MNLSPTDMGILEPSAAQTNEQINAWKAIEFSLDNIEDDFDRCEFLRACQEHDMTTIGGDWPEFVEWLNS